MPSSKGITTTLAAIKPHFWQEIRFSLLLSALHSLLFNTLCYYIYAGEDLGYGVLVGSISIFVTWPLFYLITWAKRHTLWLYGAIFLLDGMAGYFIYTYKLELRADTLALLYESNIEEASAFIGLPLVLWLGFCIAAALLIARFNPASLLRASQRGWVLLLLLVVGLLSYRVFKLVDYRMFKPLPLSLVQESKTYFNEKARLQNLLSKKEDIGHTLISTPADTPLVVLVLGESARGDHFALNGYPRDTNPELTPLAPLSYPNVTSCANKTRISVPCLLTRNTVADHRQLLRESSLISVFRAAGYTTGWYSNQRVMHKNDTVTTSIANEAEQRYFSRFSYNNVRDEELLPKLREFLHQNQRPKLLVAHSIGSHWAYDHRYAPHQEVFSPSCSSSTQMACSSDSLINAYDNSIVHTDHFLAELIKEIQDKNALLVYVSDHGESLGEGGFFSHGQDQHRPEQYGVPLILWASDAFKQRHPERYQAAADKLEQALNHDVIFHSLLDCAGIEASTIDRSLSLCAPPLQLAAQSAN